MINQITRSLLVLIIFICKNSPCIAGQITVINSDLFGKDPVITEYFAYQLLEKNPLKNAHYVAAPWAYLINHNLLAQIPKIDRIENGVTVCQHINYEQIIPHLKAMGIKTLFTPHVPNGKKFEGITVLPFPHFAVNGTVPAKNKDIFYSFVGVAYTHPTRKTIFSVKHPANSYVKERIEWHFNYATFRPDVSAKERAVFEKKEYQNILARSRFSLCPRGTGASTIRFWESLQAGAIPVLIGNDMSLPMGFDWNKCVIKMHEDQIRDIANILQKILPEQENAMRKTCIKAFKQFSGDNFVSSIRLYFQQNY